MALLGRPSPDEITAARLAILRELVIRGQSWDVPSGAVWDSALAALTSDNLVKTVDDADPRRVELDRPTDPHSVDVIIGARILLVWMEDAGGVVDVQWAQRGLEAKLEAPDAANGLTWLRTNGLVALSPTTVRDLTGDLARPNPRTDRGTGKSRVRAQRTAESKRIRANYDKIVQSPTPTWFKHPDDSKWTPEGLRAIRKCAWELLRGLDSSGAIAMPAWRAILERHYADHYEAALDRLTDAGFLTIDGDVATVHPALPAQSWKAERRQAAEAEKKKAPSPSPEPAPVSASPEQAQSAPANTEDTKPEPAAPAARPVQITHTTEERELLVKAARLSWLRVYPKQQPVAAALVERGLLTPDPDRTDAYLYSHPSDAALSADDLRTVREYTTAVIKKLRSTGRNSLAGLDEKVGVDIANTIKQRLDGVLITNDGQGRWSLIGGKPRLTAQQQRERAEAKAASTTADGDTAPEPAPAPAPPTPEVTTLHEVREVKTMVAALLTAHNVRPASPSSHPRAHGMAETQWRIATVLQALGPSLMSTVTAGYLTKSQREHTNSAIAQGLLDGTFEEVSGLGRKPRIKVAAPPKGRSWDELHLAAEEVKARDAAKRVSA